MNFAKKAVLLTFSMVLAQAAMAEYQSGGVGDFSAKKSTGVPTASVPIMSLTSGDRILRNPSETKSTQDTMSKGRTALPTKVVTGPLKLVKLKESESNDVRGVNACEFVGWVFQDISSPASGTAGSIVALTENTKDETSFKDIIMFSSRSENQQHFAYSKISKKFYRLDDRSGELIEMATPSKKLSEKEGAKIFNFEDGGLIEIPDFDVFMAQAQKVLGGASSAATSAASYRLSCNDSSWYIQKIAAAAKAKATEKKSRWGL